MACNGTWTTTNISPRAASPLETSPGGPELSRLSDDRGIVAYWSEHEELWHHISYCGAHIDAVVIAKRPNRADHGHGRTVARAHALNFLRPAVTIIVCHATAGDSISNIDK